MSVFQYMVKIIVSVVKVSRRHGSSLSPYRLLLHVLIDASNLIISAAEQYPRHAGEQYRYAWLELWI